MAGSCGHPRDVVVGDLDEIRNEVGGPVETVGGKPVPQPRERAREEHDNEIAEVRIARSFRHAFGPVMTSRCLAQ